MCRVYSFFIGFLLTHWQILRAIAVPARFHHVRLGSPRQSRTVPLLNTACSENTINPTATANELNSSPIIAFTQPQTVNVTATITQFPSTTTVFISTNRFGHIHTALERQGHPSVQPFPIAYPPADFLPQPALNKGVSPAVIDLTGTQRRANWKTFEPVKGIRQTQGSSHIHHLNKHRRRRHHHHQGRHPNMNRQATIYCFEPASVGPIPDQIRPRGGHPVPRNNISPANSPVSTNKFYVNFFVGDQNQGVWTHPYSLTWNKGGGNLNSWGMTVSHIDASQRAFGPQNNAIPGSPVQYYINPIGIQSLIISAIELGSSTKLTLDSPSAMSAHAILSPRAGSTSYLSFPLCQGMAFVTSLYVDLMPSIQSAVYFRTLTQVGSPRPGIFKYRIVLEDGKNWLLYAIPSNGADPKLKLVSTTQVQGMRGWTGMIQVAKNPTGAEGEKHYDVSAGVYASHAAVSATVEGSTGTYGIEWTKSGLVRGQTLLMYALPHHVQSFSSATTAKKTPLQLQTTTKGVATAILADSWTLVESNLPMDIEFNPWSPSTRSKAAISSQTQGLIQQVAISEINQDIDAQTNLDSMYFSGKALSKFAILIYTMHDLLNQKDAALKGLVRLKAAFARFVTNTQINPLVYDTVWKGVVSSGGYSGDLLQDFGNTAYNDHHFHYGYFIHTAAVIAHLDPNYLTTTPSTFAWITTLIRDAANPSPRDPYFPFSRAFDYYHGHSWAQGLFASADGKDQESTSEDAMFAYALKLWGSVTHDPSTEARGTLMLAILRRSLDNYFLLQHNNANQPAPFLANKVTGILFENKVDHTTYFGTRPEYIQGIHMLPLLPSSAYTRSPTFITEEWKAYFAQGAFDDVERLSGGWKGVLLGNWACVQPKEAWEAFSRKGWEEAWIDGGASRTWYLAFAAGE